MLLCTENVGVSLSCYSAVGVGFVFGCMVMILSAFGFFFGSNAQKVCQSLEGPEYEGFANVSHSCGTLTQISIDH